MNTSLVPRPGQAGQQLYEEARRALQQARVPQNESLGVLNALSNFVLSVDAELTRLKQQVEELKRSP